jgi:hypothetical protein
MFKLINITKARGVRELTFASNRPVNADVLSYKLNQEICNYA